MRVTFPGHPWPAPSTQFTIKLWISTAVPAGRVVRCEVTAGGRTEVTEQTGCGRGR